MDITIPKMRYLLLKGVSFQLTKMLVFCVMTQLVGSLPVVPDSVQNSELITYSNRLPSDESSPVFVGPKSLVQYSHANQPSGLAKQNGAHLKPMQPQSAKPTGFKSTNKLPDYAAEHSVDSTSIHSSHSFNSNQIGKHSKKSRRGGSKSKTAQIIQSDSQALQYESKNYVQTSLENADVQVNFKLHSDNSNYNLEEDGKAENGQALQLAVKNDNTVTGEQTEISEKMLSVGTALVALFSLGVIIGIFGCCCKKKSQNEEVEKAEKAEKAEKTDKESKAVTDITEGKTNGEQGRPLASSKKPSEVFNTR